MKSSYVKALSLMAIIAVCLSVVPFGRTQAETQNYTASFLLLNRPDGDKTYELNITIPQTLYQYYVMQNHALYSNDDFPKFVSPYALEPIADRLWQIYNNTEDFTNGVLELVHQIAYKEIIPGKYPVETLVGGNGDCDLFATIAASILEAAGIPTVLLYYREQQHMEIGVDLGSAPTEARVDTFSVNVQNVSYYIGECTGGKWREGWRIGETPIEYQNVTAEIITLGGIEQTSIGQVGASLRELDLSTLSLQASSTLLLEDSNVTLSGQILPQTPNENVTLRAQMNNGGWTTIGTVLTQSDGRFNYSWMPPAGGIIAVQASWVGNRQFNGATSSQMNVIIVPMLVLVLLVALAVAVTGFGIVLYKTLRRKPKMAAAQAPDLGAGSPTV